MFISSYTHVSAVLHAIDGLKKPLPVQLEHLPVPSNREILYEN